MSEWTYGSGLGISPKISGRQDTPHMARIYLPQLLPLEDYDQVIVLFSGGKDSLACILDLLERGVPREKIQLWHHDIDGGHPTRKMDWPVTQNYVKAVAEYLGIPLRVSWRVNGFWGEVYRLGASWPAQKFPLPLRFRLRRKLRRTGNFFAFGPDSLRWIPARENMGPRRKPAKRLRWGEEEGMERA